MERKQKVINALVVSICLVVLAAVGYLAYFILSDTLKPPPDALTLENLFVAKQKKDIGSLKTTTNIDQNKVLYDNILLSLKEDIINSFIDNTQFKSLDKNLNFAYTEQFIVLANKYFEQPEWRNNQFVSKIITEIKDKGFVEQDTPIWDTLQGFEANITCFNEMQKCISEINKITNNLRNFIPLDKISDINNQKQNFANQNCLKNDNVKLQLESSYENLEIQAKANARLNATPMILEFDPSGGSKTINVLTNVSSWSYSAVYSWLSIRKDGSSLTITCEANPNLTERTDTMDIIALEKSVNITIMQKANQAVLSEFSNITGKIENVWVEHNVFQNGLKGMKIHVKFSVYGMLNKQGTCIAWFFYSNGTAVKDTNGIYKSSDGQVSVGEKYKPSYDNAICNDFLMFMPYNELHLNRGSYNLKFHIGLFDQNNKQIANSVFINFDVNQQ